MSSRDQNGRTPGDAPGPHPEKPQRQPLRESTDYSERERDNEVFDTIKPPPRPPR